MDDYEVYNVVITKYSGKINPLPFQGRAYKSAFFYLNNLCAKQGFHLVSITVCRRIEGRAAGKKDWVPSDGQPDWFSINNWTHNSYLSSDILLHKALFSKKRRRGKTSFRANFGRSGQKVNQELGFESQPSFSFFQSCQRALITQSATERKKCEFRSIRVMNRYFFYRPDYYC